MLPSVAIRKTHSSSAIPSPAPNTAMAAVSNRELPGKIASGIPPAAIKTRPVKRWWMLYPATSKSESGELCSAMRSAITVTPMDRISSIALRFTMRSDVRPFTAVRDARALVVELPGNIYGCAPPGRTASASISTSHSGSRSPPTFTIVLAGRMSEKNSPCARPICSQSSTRDM